MFCNIQMLHGDTVLYTLVNFSGPAFMRDLEKHVPLFAVNGIPFITFAALIDDDGMEVKVGKEKNFSAKGILCALDVDDDDDDNKDNKKEKAIEIANQIGSLYVKTTKPFRGAPPFHFEIGDVELNEKFLSQVVIDSDATRAVAMMYHEDLKNETFDNIAEAVIENYFIPSASPSTTSLSRKSAIVFQYNKKVKHSL